MGLGRWVAAATAVFLCLAATSGYADQASAKLLKSTADHSKFKALDREFDSGPEVTKACNTDNLPAKPTMGGTPASENMHKAMTPAYKGLRWFRPAKSVISSLSKPSRASNMMMPNTAKVVSTYVTT